MSAPPARRFLAEFLGTFALVLVGCGAIVVDAHTGGAVTLPGIALSFGLIVMVVIYALGDVSGAHLNPAVSAGFWLAGSLPTRDGLGYLVSQCAGAVVASGLLRLTFPEHPTLGSTAPALPVAASFGVEIVITGILMFVIFQVVTRGEETAAVSGLAIGSTVGLAALFAGPLTGASMNPARSLGPALVSGELTHLWLYWTAPFLGAALALFGCRAVRGGQCCR